MLIKHGRVVDPVTGTDAFLDVRILEDRIAEVAPNLAPAGQQEQVLDAAGCIVAPGLMDAHVHFRDPGFPWKETISTGARAAAKGGFTRVVCMANTNPVVDHVKTLRENLAKGEKTGIEVLQTSAVTLGLQGKELVDFEAMAAAGAAGFTDDGIPLMDEGLLLKAMEYAAKLHLPISLHEEDPLLIASPGVNRGRVSARLGYGGADAAAEEIMVARDLILALHTGAPVCIQHVSSRVSVALLRTAKGLGADVHAEATPHHFTLTEEAVLRWGTNARVNPPLREEADRKAIIEGLADGTIDLIVTDHAPHSKEEKNQPLAKAPSGMIGLETALSLGIASLVQPGHLSMLQLLEKMSTNPARLYGVAPASVSQGARADLVIFHPNQTWQVREFVSRSSNSPFLGWELPGVVKATICRGKMVWQA